MMRLFFAWFVVLGLFAGLCGRSLAADPCEVILAMHELEHSGHHHDPVQPCDPSHEEKCPVEHHHQGLCCHVLPLAADIQSSVRAGVFAFSLSPIRCESVRPPDDPFAELDKPPLI